MNKIEQQLRFKCGIYIIINLVNGKRYIGSSKDVYNRLHEHVHNLKRNAAHNKHFQSSWNKHGEDNFIYGILEFCDEEVRFEREQFYISNMHPEYNLTENVIANFGHSPSEETRQKISNTLKKKYSTGEITTYRQEHAWIKTYVYNIENFTLCGEFDCMAEAGRALGFTNFKHHQANGVLKGKYIFSTVKFESLEDLINHASEKYLKYQGQINYLIGEDSDGNLHYYPSIAAFVRANGGSRSTISKHLDASREHPYQPKGAKMKLYTSDEYIPIKLKDAVPIEESLELLSGNIGKTPEKDNTEINSEIKESESSYSVGSETL